MLAKRAAMKGAMGSKPHVEMVRRGISKIKPTQAGAYHAAGHAAAKKAFHVQKNLGTHSRRKILKDALNYSVAAAQKTRN